MSKGIEARFLIQSVDKSGSPGATRLGFRLVAPNAWTPCGHWHFNAEDAVACWDSLTHGGREGRTIKP